MLDALLSPVSTEHYIRNVNNKVEAFYNDLTREAVRSQLRADVLDGHDQDFAAELRQATRKHNAIRQTFEDFAISVNRTSGKVWMKDQFEAFITSRSAASNGPNTTILPATSILWRCLCYNASYPFVEAGTDSDQQYIDLAGWIQGLALLTSDPRQGFGRNRAMLSLYGDGHTSAERRESTWRRFVSFSKPLGSSNDPKTECEDWHPPDIVDEISRTVAAQIPLPMKFKVPELPEVKARVQRLVPASSDASHKPEDLIIPYEDMRSLLALILQVAKNNESHGSLRESAWPDLSQDASVEELAAIADSILEAGGVSLGDDITFGTYLHFSHMFRRSDKMSPWSFNEEVVELWRALFSVKPSEQAHSALSSQHPPSSILHALDFVCPLQQDSRDRRYRRQSTLTYSSSTISEVSRDSVLQALTWPYSAKVVVMYGGIAGNNSTVSTLTDNLDKPLDDRKGSIFVVMTASPLWCNYKNGKMEDFFVGDGHVLMELAPKARVLWCPHPQKKFMDIVTVDGTNTLLFGHCATQEDDSRPRASGLQIDFEAGTATLCHDATDAEVREDDYVEVRVGPQDAPPQSSTSPEAWERVVRLRKIEVYSLPEGVDAGLSTER